MKMIGIHTGPDTHLDHLGVLCALLGIPLWVTEERSLQVAKTYYPQIDVHLKELHELTLSYMAQACDVILESGHTWAAELKPLFKLVCHKEMRIIYVPHGNSDKGLKLQHPYPKDISLIYGSHMRDLLKANGSAAKTRGYAVTGNYRYPFYQKFQEFYDGLVPFSFADHKKTLLYAPSWPDGENPSSFFKFCEKLIEDTAPFFHLIVKLHPFLEEYHPAETLAILQKYPSTIFLPDFPPIYPILNRCDAYLGDFSSIGYDFLSFNRPMFFFYEGPLSSCGVVIPEEVNIGKFILEHWDQHTFSEVRRQRYEYAFGEERSAEAILSGIKEALTTQHL